MISINDFTPAVIDLILPLGSQVNEFFTIYLDESLTTAMNLSGFIAKSQIRKTYNSSSPILTLDSSLGSILIGAKLTNGIITPDDPSNGGIALIYNADETRGITYSSDTFVRDVLLTDTHGVNRRVIMGDVTLLGEVTE